MIQLSLFIPYFEIRDADVLKGVVAMLLEVLLLLLLL